MTHATVSCFWLLKHVAACALSFALLKAGSNIAARMAIIAITTSNSIRVNAQAPGASQQPFGRVERFDSETLGTDRDWVNIRKGSNRGCFDLNLGGPKKAGRLRALRGNEAAATHGRHRNDALDGCVLHHSTLAHCPQLVLQFSSAKNIEHRE